MTLPYGHGFSKVPTRANVVCVRCVPETMHEGDSRMSNSLRHQALLCAVAGCLFFWNLGKAGLWDRDEPRNARCAVEMKKNGDWIVPTFNGELRPHKPVLLYWVMMAAYSVFGENEFGARFGSALLGLGITLLTYHVGRRLFGAGAGLWAGLVIATSLNFVVIARAATPDACLIFFATAALSVFVLGMFPKTGPEEAPSHQGNPDRLLAPSFWHFAVSYALMGMAVLAKGPVGVLLPTTVIVLYLAWNRANLSKALMNNAKTPSAGSWWERAKQEFAWLAPANLVHSVWAARPLTALVIVGCVALPWYLSVAWKTDGAFVSRFLGEHNLGRFLQPMEGHRGPVVYYLVALLIGFFPWSNFLVPAGKAVREQSRENPASRAGVAFLCIWAAVYLVFFSLAQTKLPNYILPVYPALAVLLGLALHRFSSDASGLSHKWWMASFVLLGIQGALILVGGTIAAYWFLPREFAIGLLGMIPLAGGALGAWYFYRHKTAHAAGAFALSAGLFLALGAGWGAPRIAQYQSSPKLLGWLREQPDEIELVSWGLVEPSYVYYAGQTIPRLETLEEVDQFLLDTPHGLLLTTDHELEKLSSPLKASITVVAKAPRFLKEGQVLIVGHHRQALAQRLAGERATERMSQIPATGFSASRHR